MIKRDVTGVAKKEAASDPRFMPVGALLDVAYIDRTDTTKAKAALQPAVDKLKNGVSIVIAPEAPVLRRHVWALSRRVDSTWRSKPVCRSCPW